MNRTRLLPFLILILCGSIWAGCESHTEEEIQASRIGKWEEYKSQDGSLPVARHEASYVKCGEVFVLLGGRGIRPVSIFDPRVGEWREGNAP
ncbi:MAG: hypothetical protein AAGM67_19665, partial [Bacteroidota bacterium]